jgi:endonuclease YncB( thermonuclease family)
MVNADLVRQGYTQVAMYLTNVRYQELCRTLHEEAREPRRGLWGSHPSETHATHTASSVSGAVAR